MIVEQLHLNLSVAEGLCACCAMEPINQRLVLQLLVEDELVRVLVCRHCLAEHAPELLEAIENWGVDIEL